MSVIIKDKNLKEQFMKEVVFYFADKKSTTRETAKQFGIGKSTVANYIKEMRFINKSLYDNAQVVVAINLAERALRGGISLAKIKKGENKNE